MIEDYFIPIIISVVGGVITAIVVREIYKRRDGNMYPWGIIPKQFRKTIEHIMEKSEKIVDHDKAIKRANEMIGRIETSIYGISDIESEQITPIVLDKVESILASENRFEEGMLITKRKLGIASRFPALKMKYFQDKSNKSFVGLMIVNEQEAGLLLQKSRDRFDWDNGYYTNDKEHVKKLKEIFDYIQAQV